MEYFCSVPGVQKESETEQQEGLPLLNFMMVCYYCDILFVLYPLFVTVEESLMSLKSWRGAEGTESPSGENKYV
jgi:hypothetical protein